MEESIVIRVADVIGSPICISAEDGQKIYDKIVPLLKDGRRVTISFERISMLISLFLNTAIGQLYSDFSETQLRSQLQVTGLAEDDLEILRRVVENAKKYYSNSKAYDDAWKKEVDNEE